MAIKSWLENTFNVLMLCVILYNLNKIPPLTKNTRMPNGYQRGLTQTGPLLLRNGTLAESGWSRVPLKTLNRRNFGAVVFGIPRLSSLKYRKIDEYVFFGRDSITFGVFYESVVRSFALFGRYHLEEKSFSHELQQRVGGLAAGEQLVDDVHLCPSVAVRVSVGNFTTDVTTRTEGGACASQLRARLSSGEIAQLDMRTDLLADAVVDTVRISPDGRHWLHDFKKLATAKLAMGGVKEEGLATVHFSRSLGYYKSTSLFGTAAGRVGGTDFSVSFGVQPAHNETATSEDSFFLNATAHKLNPLEIRFDRLNLLNGFTIFTAEADPLAAEGEKRSGAEFTFRAFHHAHLGANYFFVKNKWDFVFGTISGSVTDERGSPFHFEDLPAYIRLTDLKG